MHFLRKTFDDGFLIRKKKCRDITLSNEAVCLLFTIYVLVRHPKNIAPNADHNK